MNLKASITLSFPVLLASIIFIILLVGGAALIVSLSSAVDDVEASMIKKDIDEAFDPSDLSPGSLRKASIDGLGAYEEMCAVDLDSFTRFDLFEEYPLIRGELVDGTANVFLIKEDGSFDSMLHDDILIEYPHFDCSLVSSQGSVTVDVKGLGASAGVGLSGDSDMMATMSPEIPPENIYSFSDVLTDFNQDSFGDDSSPTVSTGTYIGDAHSLSGSEDDIAMGVEISAYDSVEHATDAFADVISGLDSTGVLDIGGNQVVTGTNEDGTQVVVWQSEKSVVIVSIDDENIDFPNDVDDTFMDDLLGVAESTYDCGACTPTVVQPAQNSVGGSGNPVQYCQSGNCGFVYRMDNAHYSPSPKLGAYESEEAIAQRNSWYEENKEYYTELNYTTDSFLDFTCSDIFHPLMHPRVYEEVDFTYHRSSDSVNLTFLKNFVVSQNDLIKENVLLATPENYMPSVYSLSTHPKLEYNYYRDNQANQYFIIDTPDTGLRERQTLEFENFFSHKKEQRYYVDYIPSSDDSHKMSCKAFLTLHSRFYSTDPSLTLPEYLSNHDESNMELELESRGVRSSGGNFEIRSFNTIINSVFKSEFTEFFNEPENRKDILVDLCGDFTRDVICDANNPSYLGTMNVSPFMSTVITNNKLILYSLDAMVLDEPIDNSLDYVEASVGPISYNIETDITIDAPSEVFLENLEIYRGVAQQTIFAINGFSLNGAGQDIRTSSSISSRYSYGVEDITQVSTFESMANYKSELAGSGNQLVKLWRSHSLDSFDTFEDYFAKGTSWKNDGVTYSDYEKVRVNGNDVYAYTPSSEPYDASEGPVSYVWLSGVTLVTIYGVPYGAVPVSQSVLDAYLLEYPSTLSQAEDVSHSISSCSYIECNLLNDGSLIEIDFDDYEVTSSYNLYGPFDSGSLDQVYQKEVNLPERGQTVLTQQVTVSKLSAGQKVTVQDFESEIINSNNPNYVFEKRSLNDNIVFTESYSSQHPIYDSYGIIEPFEYSWFSDDLLITIRSSATHVNEKLLLTYLDLYPSTVQ